MAKSANPLNALVGVFDKLEAQQIQTNNLLDEAVDVLYSIDKKLDKRSTGSKISISATKGSGKEIAVALEGITELVKALSASDSGDLSEGLDSVVSGIGKLNAIAENFNDHAKKTSFNLIIIGLALVAFTVLITLAAPLMIFMMPVLLLFGSKYGEFS